MNELTKTIVKGGLRSIAASFPFAGSLAQAWSEWESIIRDQRIEEFFSNVNSQLASLHEKLKPIEASSEFPALIERIVEKIQREPSASKRRLFAIVFLRSLLKGSGQHFDEKLSVIEVLDSLTESDLKILGAFSLGRRTQVDEIVPTSSFSRDEEGLGQAISPLVVSLSKLESRGLIGETVTLNRAFDYPDEASHWANRWRRKTYEILPFGKTVLESLLEPTTLAKPD